MTFVYIYRVVSDTGFAPCVDKGILSLACCKGGQIRRGKPINTGLRYWIGSKRLGIDYKKHDVYIVGLYRNNFLYLARVTHVLSMKEYYQTTSKGRLDDIYSYIDGRLVRNHNLWDEGVHIDEAQNIRDIAGEYVLLSDDFIYLGKDAKESEMVREYAPPFRGCRLYEGEIAEKIVNECKKHCDGRVHKPNTPIRRSSCSCK
ncbi:MAG: hypothetical protein J6N70_18010 [Oribacterium sp.]|nr:hypothetical protein [Oribacterium sp.]